MALKLSNGVIQQAHFFVRNPQVMVRGGVIQRHHLVHSAFELGQDGLHAHLLGGLGGQRGEAVAELVIQLTGQIKRRVLGRRSHHLGRRLLAIGQRLGHHHHAVGLGAVRHFVQDGRIRPGGPAGACRRGWRPGCSGG